MNGILRTKVKQEGIHSDIGQAENSMPNEPVISRAPQPVCLKIEVATAKKQKESFRIKGTEDKENKPAKVACSTLVLIPRHEVFLPTDDDDDLPTHLM